jgi:3-oxoacyl-[acyl-carrier-protein] synthase-3
MQPLMNTDSEQLMHEGVAAAADCFAQLMGNDSGGSQLDKTVCHQVGAAHRRLLLERLGIDPARDFVTYPWLGNTGSAALPVTLAAAATAGHFERHDAIGLLGIGSGINVVMMRLTYDQLAVAGHGRLGPLEI